MSIVLHGSVSTLRLFRSIGTFFTFKSLDYWLLFGLALWLIMFSLLKELIFGFFVFANWYILFLGGEMIVS